jgi:hypothetical protein
LSTPHNEGKKHYAILYQNDLSPKHKIDSDSSRGLTDNDPRLFAEKPRGFQIKVTNKNFSSGSGSTGQQNSIVYKLDQTQRSQEIPEESSIYEQASPPQSPKRRRRPRGVDALSASSGLQTTLYSIEQSATSSLRRKYEVEDSRELQL